MTDRREFPTSDPDERLDATPEVDLIVAAIGLDAVASGAAPTPLQAALLIAISRDAGEGRLGDLATRLHLTRRGGVPPARRAAVAERDALIRHLARHIDRASLSADEVGRRVCETLDRARRDRKVGPPPELEPDLTVSRLIAGEIAKRWTIPGWARVAKIVADD